MNDVDVYEQALMMAIRVTPIVTGNLQSTVRIVPRIYGFDIVWSAIYANRVNETSKQNAGFAERAQEMIQMYYDDAFTKYDTQNATSENPDAERAGAELGVYNKYKNDYNKLNQETYGIQGTALMNVQLPGEGE